MTEADLWRFNRVTQGWQYGRRIDWLIWASKHSECPKCKMPPYNACLNLNDVNRSVKDPRRTKQPHQERIDWALMWRGMRYRGHLDGL